MSLLLLAEHGVEDFRVKGDRLLERFHMGASPLVNDRVRSEHELLKNINLLDQLLF